MFQLKQFDHFLQHKCSPFLRLFMCSVFVPLCSEHVPGAVPACRGLCEEVHNNCLPVLESIGFVWPVYLNCSRYFIIFIYFIICARMQDAYFITNE